MSKFSNERRGKTYVKDVRSVYVEKASRKAYKAKVKELSFLEMVGKVITSAEEQLTEEQYSQLRELAITTYNSDCKKTAKSLLRTYRGIGVQNEQEKERKVFR